MAAQESAWSPAGKECDRACLVAIIDGDTNAGQVALQTRRSVQGRDNLVAIRLKVDRGRIPEIEHLWAGNIAPHASS